MKIENIFWLIGISCIGIYLSIVTARQVSSQVEIDRFLENTQSESKTVSSRSSVLSRLAEIKLDKSLWSQQRIEAHTNTAVQAVQRGASGVMSIPRLGLNAPVYEGVDDWALNRGLGWIPETAPIGTPGNVGIAGHRDGFFRVLKDISKEDIIEVVGTDSTINYRVTDTWIVDPDAVHVLDDTKHSVLTLVTCYPFYFVGDAPKRFIVRAKRIETSN